jgi:hypothetical protein
MTTMGRPTLLSQPFYSQLASRLLVLLGAASVAPLYAACGKSNDSATGGAATTTTSGSGSMSATGGAGGAPNTGISFDAGISPDALGPPPPGVECLTWSADAGACPDPSLQSIIVFALDEDGCTDAGQDSGGPNKEASDVISAADAMAPGQCCYMVDYQWCINGGRPYLIDDRPQVAPAVQGACSWSGPTGVADHAGALTEEQRASLAAAWTADALLEHASVASFSRFSLSLLAAGAPAELLVLTHRAALDEVRHAALCFALAGTYAGEPVAPGPFPVGSRVDVDADLSALAVHCVREGCVGETVSAIVAAEQLARATDPAVRAALAEIAADEARHAELAWRTVAWAIEAGGSPVREAVARAFASISPRPASAHAGGDDARGSLEAHGRLDAATTAEVMASAISGVVLPAARALLRDDRGSATTAERACS